MNTQFIIKPDAYLRRIELLNRFEQKGYSIISADNFVMTEKIFSGIYYGLIPSDIFVGVMEYMMENYCVRVQSDIPIEDLLRITGINLNPALCDIGTIRNEFGAGIGITKSGFTVIRNAIHRPKSSKQNLKNYELLELLL